MSHVEKVVSAINPMGTNGFSFVEFTHSNSAELEKLFRALGFICVGRHKIKDIVHYQQGDINFLINRENRGQGHDFFSLHGNCANAMGFRIAESEKAYERALSRGAKPYREGLWTNQIPAIQGIGGSVLYLVDPERERSVFFEEFDRFHPEGEIAGTGLHTLDHLTHNVDKGQMDVWAKFYEDLFNFKEIRYFDISGEYTGLFSRAMVAPCGKLKIPLNESQDDQSQIAEYLKEYKGEGIQHIALMTDNIYETVDRLIENNIIFQGTPDTYYEAIDTRISRHEENIEGLQSRGILIDGSLDKNEGILLQIFTQTVIGPIFFEIIQRKGNQGFGEGNFQALFDSIERDQIRRGVLKRKESV